MKDDDHFFILFFYGPNTHSMIPGKHLFINYNITTHFSTVTLSMQCFSPLRLDSLRSKEVASLHCRILNDKICFSMYLSPVLWCTFLAICVLSDSWTSWLVPAQSANIRDINFNIKFH